MDAIRISDGTRVALKIVWDYVSPYEVSVHHLLSTPPLSLDPRNHCVQAIEILQVPDDPHRTIIVMPLLRPFDDPPFLTVGECMGFFIQIFEVGRFLLGLDLLLTDYRVLNSCTTIISSTGK